eukprot:11774302-Ditylum_brightwellii.AAC.1
MMMAANHLGHFLLANLLFSHLTSTASKTKDTARIIHVTSSTYHLAGPIDLQDLMADGSNRTHTLFGQYAMTKLANILTTRQLYYQHTSSSFIQSYAVHPGLVRTEVTKNMPPYLQILNKMFAWVVAIHQKSPPAGAYTSVFCATAPVDALVNGAYYVNSQVQALNKYALDVDYAYNSKCLFLTKPTSSLYAFSQTQSQSAKKLWSLSEELVGLKKASATLY